MKRLLYLAPLIVVLVIVGYFASGLTRDPHELPSALIDRPFPAVDLPPISGHAKGFATADLAGQVALVNVFASWCVPCKVEHPLLMAHAKDGAIPIYGIAWKDDPAATADLLEQDGDPYRLVGADRATIVAEASRLLTDPGYYRALSRGASPYGDGYASARIATLCRQFLVGSG
jgi:cytochrome c biogenesis protein CcmG/thiol:disulfide interchange protein DsbE